MHICVTRPQWVNTLRPEQNGCHVASSIFIYIFFKEILHFDSNSLDSCSQGSHWQYVYIGLGNGLGTIWWQTITWTIVDQDLWHHTASLPTNCSNYIFILDLTPGFNGLGKINRKTRRETFKLGGIDVSFIRRSSHWVNSMIRHPYTYCSCPSSSHWGNKALLL